MYHLCLVHKAQGPKGKQRGRVSSHPVFWSTGPSPRHSVLWNYRNSCKVTLANSRVAKG